MSNTLLTTYDNNDKAITVVLKDADGNAIDITNYTFWLTVRKTTYDSTKVIQKTKSTHNGSNDDPANGKTVFSITKSDNDIETGDYLYDIQTQDDDGNITTQTTGTYRVFPRITEEVDVNPPNASFNFSPSFPGNGEDIQFTNTSLQGDSSITSYLWEFDDGFQSTLENPTYSYDITGTYSVKLTVTDTQGISDSSSQDIEIGDIEVSADFDTSISDLEVDFTDTSTSTAGSITSWLWEFGDGNTSTKQNPTHTYSSSDSYTVKLEATDDQGNTGITTQTVDVSSGGTGGGGKKQQ